MSASPGNVLPESSSQDPRSSSDRRVPAWLLSVVFHVTVMLALGFLVSDSARSRSIEADRPAGITLVHTSDARVQYFDGDDSQQASPSQDSNSAAMAALPGEATAATAPAVTLPLPGTPAIDGGNLPGLPNASGFTKGMQSTGQVSGGGSQTSVFGAEARGSKFVYVFDRSSSMDGFQGRPMRAARAELIASLKQLDSTNQFQIVFYNERPTVLNPFAPRAPSMLFASEENKRLAEDFVRRIEPLGATRHMVALEIAINLQPDVIFFLTDAAEPQLTPQELSRIRRRNRSSASIHAIEFGSGPSTGESNFLTRLAAQNAGQHVYVDLAKLSSP